MLKVIEEIDKFAIPKNLDIEYRRKQLAYDLSGMVYVFFEHWPDIKAYIETVEKILAQDGNGCICDSSAKRCHEFKEIRKRLGADK